MFDDLLGPRKDVKEEKLKSKGMGKAVLGNEKGPSAKKQKLRLPKVPKAPQVKAGNNIDPKDLGIDPAADKECDPDCDGACDCKPEPDFDPNDIWGDAVEEDDSCTGCIEEKVT